jgi:hypothetical protein
MHECQNKGDRKWAICKRLILKGALIFVQTENGPKRQPEKEKRELGSRTPHKVFSNFYFTKGITKVKEKLAEMGGATRRRGETRRPQFSMISLSHNWVVHPIEKNL